ncbi:MAG: sulfotransferase family 2 domain-containing protein [Paracoccaceae bacterium]
MLYREKRLIFVHVPKVAGQSIEHAFLADAGADWESREPFLLSRNVDSAKGPPRLAHLLARDYVRCGHIEQPDFDAFYKFTFVREPLSRALSMYKYEHADQKMAFRDYLEDYLPDRISGSDNYFHRPQSDYITDGDGRVIVDFIGRFENLAEDFARVCGAIGMANTRLPHVNKTQKAAGDLVAENAGLMQRLRHRAATMKRLLRQSGREAPAHYRAPTLSEARSDGRVLAAVQTVYAADYEQFGYPKM